MLLDREENIYDPNRGVVRRCLGQDLDTSFGLSFVEFINEVPRIVSEAVNRVSLKSIHRDGRDAHFAPVGKRRRKQDMLHAQLRY